MRKILLFSTLLVAMPWLWCPDVAAADKLDLNQATVEELDTLPGVGPAIARRIVAFREKNGAFKRIEDLMNVRGIGEKTFLRLRDRIMVKAAPPPCQGAGEEPVAVCAETFRSFEGAESRGRRSRQSLMKVPRGIGPGAARDFRFDSP